MKIIRNLAPDDSIRISWYSERTELLGPYSRFALWVQGCERGCKGCIASEMQSLSGGEIIKITDLSDIILSCDDIEGMTLSGGEPFYQSDKISELISKIRSVRPDFGVIIYTGFQYEELCSSDEEGVGKLVALADILIDGAYIEELDDNAGLRGSSNQRVNVLTERYKDCMEQYENPSGRKNSFVFSGQKLQMIGIPSLTSKTILRNTGAIK